MQYRALGRLGIKVSALGFGCMRLPTTGEHGEIDEPLAIAMLRHAIDQGVNYVDTSYVYHGGNSERVLGKALRDGYRERVYLADKMPPWSTNSVADMDRILDEELDRLQANHLDCYLLHSLNRVSWQKLHGLGVLDWAQRAMRAGRFHHLAFSFHDNYAAFQEIVDATDLWAFAQIQYNYLDVDENPGTRGLEYAAAKGLGVVVMEPLLGGKLVNPPDAVQSLWDQATVRRSAADWALLWLWDRPEVSTVLSGMSTMQQVVENLDSAERSRVGLLTPGDRAIVARVRDAYRALCPIPCTGCRYCMPCPNGVEIPANFRLLNEGVMYNVLEQRRRHYAGMPESQRASACIACRECETKCPQHILMSEEMPRVQAVLGEGQAYTCRP